MDELALIKQQIDLLRKETDVNTKSAGMEFERISKAFMQMGNLLDLLYLETSVLIETLDEKKVINKEDFTKKLEETAKKIEEDMLKKSKEGQPEEGEVKSEKL